MKDTVDAALQTNAREHLTNRKVSTASHRVTQRHQHERRIT